MITDLIQEIHHAFNSTFVTWCTYSYRYLNRADQPLTDVAKSASAGGPLNMTPRSPEAEWLAVLHNVPKWVPPMWPTVVIAPHPDDETLGAGRLIATQRRQGVPVTIVAVTNGEAAYPMWRALESSGWLNSNPP